MALEDESGKVVVAAVVLAAMEVYQVLPVVDL
jgi:hypothetical protein